MRALVDPATALARLRALLAPYLRTLHLESDDFGNALLFARRDMTHLDADALNDRLHAWCVREVQRTVPHASALVSFRHARPATHDEASLDVQEVWVGLEPTFRLELARPNATDAGVVAFARSAPPFGPHLVGRGRPPGGRPHDEGNVE